MPDPRSVSIATVLLLLRHMRDALGLEAMSEFLDAYTILIKEHHPEIPTEIDLVLRDKALSALYETVIRYEKD
ncbi:MAG: hypothetical protein GX606_02805 [Elusimicrobia bacterium]|nr:hypothetical protein [Elusimicrobiota bacterium]